VETARKITVEVPLDLLEKAQRASGTGITQTVRTGLQLSCGIADLRSPTPAPREGSLHAYVGKAEGRPMIAADTSTWVAFLEGGRRRGCTATR